jgi:hypothetical protein
VKVGLEFSQQVTPPPHVAELSSKTQSMTVTEQPASQYMPPPDPASPPVKVMASMTVVLSMLGQNMARPA